MSDISKINIENKEYKLKDAEGRARAEEAATEAVKTAKEYTDVQVKALKGEVSEDFDTLEKTENMIISLGDSTYELFTNVITPKINEVDEIAKTVLDIAQGNTRSEVFETTSAMYAWLANAANKGVLKTGDNLYIKELDVPDWWITEALDAPNADGRYYNIAPLEAEGAGAAGSTVSVQQILTSGTEIGSITVDGTSTKLYAPEAQNAFGNVVVENTTIAADSKTDSLTLVAGNNVTITPDATNDKITIAATDTKYTLDNITGTLAVAKGGTGATTLASGQALIGNGTDVVTTRAINTLSAVGNIGYGSSNANDLATISTLAFWNGQYYKDRSNLAYCNKGAFGDAAIKGVDTIPTDGSGNLITSDAVYDELIKKLSLTGGALTGDIAIPTAKATLESSVPVASGAVTISSISELSNYKTYLGTMQYNGAWNDIISIRHRNGHSDGSNFGMYIRSTLQNENNLLWGKQYGAEKWQAERTILDSANRNNYPPNKVLDAGDGRAITFAYSKDGMSTTSWLASWNGAQLEAISPGNALKAMNGLPLSGGTMTGIIKLTDNYGIDDTNGNGFLYRSTSATSFGSILNKYPVYIGTMSSNDVTYLRGANIVINGVNHIYASQTIAVHSDQRVKNNESLISEEIDKYVNFFDKLQPRKYNYTRDEEGASKNIGFFAQEVHQALSDSGLELKDFAGLHIDETFVDGWAEGTSEAVWYEDFYSLAYEQFIPIIVAKIQHMEQQYNNKIKTLEEEYNNKLINLEERLIKIEEVK